MKMGSNIGPKRKNCFLTRPDIRAFISNYFDVDGYLGSSVIDKKLPDDDIFRLKKSV
jgi:hypothetical protein